MKIKWPFSKTYVVKCPDGTTRVIYKNIDDAFPLCIPGWKGKTGGSIEAIKGASVNINAEYQTQIQGLLYSLDELNQSLTMVFRAAYIAYQSHPCKNAASFNRLIEKMIHENSRLTALKIKIRGLISLAETNPNNQTQWVDAFQSVVDQIGGQSIVVAAKMEIAEARTEMRQLEGGPNAS
ncbi:MAG: hypothetical protein Q7U71_10505 [bacterium]|nr:hypothetical protein [bacterium]